MSGDDARRVRPDGLAIRGLRHARGWSPRDLAEAITAAHLAATGLPVRVAPRVLTAVEERNAVITYDVLCTIAAGLDCNPVEILLEDPATEVALDAPRGPLQ
jgi:transcriptional regulator with XRE-family HTH domain